MAFELCEGWVVSELQAALLQEEGCEEKLDQHDGDVAYADSDECYLRRRSEILQNLGLASARVFICGEGLLNLRLALGLYAP